MAVLLNDKSLQLLFVFSRLAMLGMEGGSIVA